MAFTEKERWRSGHVEVLSPEDDSPFLLGDIAPGAARLAIDTNMFRAGAPLWPLHMHTL